MALLRRAISGLVALALAGCGDSTTTPVDPPLLLDITYTVSYPSNTEAEVRMEATSNYVGGVAPSARCSSQGLASNGINKWIDFEKVSTPVDKAVAVARPVGADRSEPLRCNWTSGSHFLKVEHIVTVTKVPGSQ